MNASDAINTIKTVVAQVAQDPSKYQATLAQVETASQNVLKFVQLLKTGDQATIEAAIKTAWPDVDELYSDQSAMDSENAKKGITADEILADAEKALQFAGTVGGLVIQFGPLLGML